MRVHLLYPDRDLDLKAPPTVDAKGLLLDFALGPIFDAMSGGDPLMLSVAQSVLLAHGTSDPDVVRYRQGALTDCLERRDEVRALYDCAGDALSAVRKLGIFGFYARSPSSVLYGAVRVLGSLSQSLEQLRSLAERSLPHVRSEAFASLCRAILVDLDDAFFDDVRRYRGELEFRPGMLFSARLGAAQRGSRHALRRESPGRRGGWLGGLLGGGAGGQTFAVAGRDEAGHAALRALRDRVLNEPANALAQSNDHVLAFFSALRSELAFYLGCANLRDALADRGVAVCLPAAGPATERQLSYAGLADPSLALVLGAGVVTNDGDTAGRCLIVVTGANRGGKTTFLRSLGQAQLMMQAGMFVAARAYRGSLCDGLYAHFKHEEDVSMTGGKLDEELGRLGDIVGRLRRDSLLLLNESFGSTNEAEGSELARQVIAALADHRVRVVFVTHLSEFARLWHAAGRPDSQFLRAERLADGTRTFRLVEAPPLDTSFADDVFRRVFGGGPA